MKNNIVKEKSFLFAVSIIHLYKQLSVVKKEYVMSKQLLRCGTSVGANVHEAINAESRADFIHKLGIAQKECGETIYWLDLLKQTGYFEDQVYNRHVEEAAVLLKIIRSIILTCKKKTARHS